MRYFRASWPLLLGVGLLLSLSAAAAAAKDKTLASFTVKDHLDHAWQDELVHFPFEIAGKASHELTLVDAAGAPLPTQVSDVAMKDGKLTGKAWAVVTLQPRQELTLQLRRGKAPDSDLRVESSRDELVLRNDRLAVRLPRLAALKQPVDLTALPTPLLALGDGAGNWYGQGRWVNEGAALQVKQATTTILEQGPVRVSVRYRLTFSDNRFYQADITLASRQDVLTFIDETDVDSPQTQFRLAMTQGLGADRVYWRSNHYGKFDANDKPQAIDLSRQNVVFSLCPWSFWWQENRSTVAGFYKDGGEAMVGVIGIRPSRWTPIGWAGFDRTLVPVTARADGQLDLSLALLATAEKKLGGPCSAHRELGFTVGRVADNVTADRRDIKLRGQLLKYSEFPLDQVKDYAFDFPRRAAERKHPFLLFTQADVDRARRQTQSVPMFKTQFDASVTYLGRLGSDLIAKINSGPDGWRKFFYENYVGNGLYDVVPTAFLGSDDPKFGVMLAAGVKGIAEQVRDQFLNKPGRASLASNGHMSGTSLLRLLLAYDAVADAGLLTEQEKADIEAVIVFSGFVFDHPDYWNTDVGLCSANPNMTSLLRLPLGLVGLFLDGHPRAGHWLEFAEKELQYELTDDWIAPGGAWLECPMYQAPSLDGMFLLAQAIRNVRGTDYFANPKFKETMNYYGFIMTPPDVRTPWLAKKENTAPAPMTTPSVGDAFPCFTQPFNGWMARVTAQSDPQFSAIQQGYWRGTSYSTLNGGRAGFVPALCDAELPAAAPVELAMAFPGYGNIMRTSWDDPKAGYVSHRCGYFQHHFDPGDGNSFIYYAKGAPLCVDFGHRGATADEVRTMWKPMYHSTVTFDRAEPHRYWDSSGGPVDANSKAQDVRSLPSTIDYCTGITFGAGGQRNNRHLLLVKSHDSMGATYLVSRDLTFDNQPQQSYTWSLWCMSNEVEIAGNIAHFPGQFEVDLDAHLLAPAKAQLLKDQYEYEQWVNPWGKFREKQFGVHAGKSGSSEDFFAVMFPRAAGQPAAKVSAVAEARAARVEHFEGVDLLLLSPGKPVTAADGEFSLSGEIAFARRYRDGVIRLALVKGSASAACGAWVLAGDKPVAVQIRGRQITGESSGAAGAVTLSVPASTGEAALTINGAAAPLQREGDRLVFELPQGAQSFTISIK